MIFKPGGGGEHRRRRAGAAMLIRGQAGGKASEKEGGEPKQQPRVKSLLSLYAEAPTGEIRLEEFERFSIDRLMGACRRTDGRPS